MNGDVAKDMLAANFLKMSMPAESDDYQLQPWQQQALEESMAEYKVDAREGELWTTFKERLIARLQ